MLIIPNVNATALLNASGERGGGHEENGSERLNQLNVNGVSKNLFPGMTGLDFVLGDACSITFRLPKGRHGKAGGLTLRGGMSQFARQLIIQRRGLLTVTGSDMFWSIVSSWKKNSVGILQKTKQFITSMGLKLTIALKIFNFETAGMEKELFFNAAIAVPVILCER